MAFGLRDDAERTRGELLSANRLAAHDLDKKVVERTQEMHLAMLSANEASRAKTEFLARVSHDLRSPLTSIMGYAQLLQEAGGKTSAHARIIRRSAWHMLNLINDLIDYARGASSDTLEPSASLLFPGCFSGSNLYPSSSADVVLELVVG